MKKIKSKLLIILYWIFLPISLLWEFAYRLRRFCYYYGIFKQSDFFVPIISVGNLVFGGTGKTPFTLWLAEFCDSLNKKVMIVMRGYKGGLENSRGILKSSMMIGYNPFDYGDEAILLIKRLKNASVVVGKNRSSNLKHYFDKELPDVVILDDGHQHLKIARDLNIVLFDAMMPLEAYKNPPLGYLREGLSALSSADIVVLGRSDMVSFEKLDQLKFFLKKYLPLDVPFAEIKYKAVSLVDCMGNCFALDKLKDQKVICVSGIASPDSFFKSVQSLGANIVDSYTFTDHHYFLLDDILPIITKATQDDCLIITTEKDMVKLKRIVSDERLYFLKISVEFLSGEDELINLVKNTIGK